MLKWIKKKRAKKLPGMQRDRQAGGTAVSLDLLSFFSEVPCTVRAMHLHPEPRPVSEAHHWTSKMGERG